jgi:hypothetical protein
MEGARMKIGEAITIYEHEHGGFVTARKATLFRDGTIEYWPEPVYEDEDEDITAGLYEEEDNECNIY